MRFELLCCATLAARSICRVAGLTDADSDLLPAHPAFLGVRRLRFAFEEGPAPGAGARSADEWLEQLRDEGLTRMWLEAGGAPVLRVVIDEGAQAWEALVARPSVTMLGRWEEAEPPHASEAESLRRELEASLASAAGRATGPVASATIRRALAILRSAADGQEVADTAWPHFILPDTADPNRRRLLAAAATVLPDDSLGAAPVVDPMVEQIALRALAAAVNGASPQRPVQ